MSALDLATKIVIVRIETPHHGTAKSLFSDIFGLVSETLSVFEWHPLVELRSVWAFGVHVEYRRDLIDGEELTDVGVVDETETA